MARIDIPKNLEKSFQNHSSRLHDWFLTENKSYLIRKVDIKIDNFLWMDY